MLAGRSKKTPWNSFSWQGRRALLMTWLDHRHSRVREPKMAEDFVVHSLRHTMLTRFGLLGVDAFFKDGPLALRLEQRTHNPYSAFFRCKAVAGHLG
jgi:hypothetical protein